MGNLIFFLLIILFIGVFPLGAYLARSIRDRKPITDTLDGEWIKEKTLDRPHDWWEAQRGRFNIGLLVGGVGYFILYLILYFPYLQFYYGSTQAIISALLFLAVVYLIYMGVANLFYNLGVMYETMRQPAKLDQYRQRAFRMAFWLAIIIPYLTLLFYYF
jgi:hypothetical protein